MKDTTPSKLGGACSILAGVTLIVVGVLLPLLPPRPTVEVFSSELARQVGGVGRLLAANAGPM